MSTPRVVITGVGVTSPIGNDMPTISHALQTMQHGIRPQPEWDQCAHLRTRLGASVEGIERSHFPRKAVRTVGRVGLLSLFSTEQAIADAGISPEQLHSGRVGLAYGSTHGSSAETEKFCRTLFGTNSLLGVDGGAYLKFMSHTCASNLATHFGIRGRILTTCAACVSGSHAIGYGYEAVKFGLQDMMICGGAEELHFTHAVVFDILNAASARYNDTPDQSPRPFDVQRDGLVVGEGAATVVLETFEHARKRGAHIYAEVLGYGTNCDGTHITSPSAEGMAGAMRLALADAALASTDIDYLNAHATATEAGDIAESHATWEVFGQNVPVSSTKGYTAHTLGAAGSIEVVLCLTMMRDGFTPPTRNLAEVDPRCAALNYIRDTPRAGMPHHIMSNNFAFGGINTSLILGQI